MVTSAKKKFIFNPATPRNREATRARLIQAVGTLLAREGFTGLGVNAVAREAGVDKVLIYRYFGGLSELIVAFGREGNFWPSIKELADGDVEAYSRLPVSEQLSRLSRNFIQAIRQRPITQEILAWEMVERNDLTVEFRSSLLQHSIEIVQSPLFHLLWHRILPAIAGRTGSWRVLCHVSHIEPELFHSLYGMLVLIFLLTGKSNYDICKKGGIG